MTWAIKVEDVSKRYRVGVAYKTLRDSLAHLTRNGFRRSGVESGSLALDRVSFEVGEGEAFGIVGPNGAGKTTALKLLCRISPPTGGRIRIRGTIGALLEVGSGTHPELTGRENIWLYGKILGLSRTEVARRFDDIVDFAELGQVLDKPVKMYSSGMQLRLGFSVASHLNPDIFVVDEALAVGDAVFQARCVERMMSLVYEGTTLVFVSHQLTVVESLCQRGLFLRAGRIASMGEMKSVLKEYLESTERARLERWQIASHSSNGDVSTQVIGATCHDAYGHEKYEFTSDEPIEIRITFRSPRPIRKPHVSIGITDGRPQMLILCSTLHGGEQPELVENEWVASCTIERLNLMPRVYRVWSGVNSEHGHVALLSDWQEVILFRVVATPGEAMVGGKSAVTFESLHGAVKSKYRLSYRTKLDHIAG